ncbi:MULTISPECIES: hypothetical protein [Anaerostipes]
MDTLKRSFARTLQREGKTMTAVTQAQDFNVVFRKNNDGLEDRDSSIIYYEIDAPVEIGTLLQYKGKYYIVLNKETAENDVYYKSAIQQTDGILNLNTGTVTGLRIICLKTTSISSASDGTMILLSGDLELILEDNSDSKRLTIGGTFNEYGGTYKIKNIMSKNGICHLYCERTADEQPTINYRLVLGAYNKAYQIPSSPESGIGVTKLETTAYMNDQIVFNPTIEWLSSNNDVATIAQDGTVTFIKAGIVKFTARWTEHDVEVTTDEITVTESEPEVNPWTLSITSRYSKMYTNKDIVFTFVTKNDGVKEHLDGLQYEITSDYSFTFVTEKFDTTANTLTLKTTDNGAIGKKFTLRVYHTAKKLEATKDVTVESLI